MEMHLFATMVLRMFDLELLDPIPPLVRQGGRREEGRREGGREGEEEGRVGRSEL